VLEEIKLVCKRCGFTEFLAPEKRRRKDDLCIDCRRTPAKSISYGFGKPCLPYGGDYDQDDNPIFNGQLLMPGERICKHRDCVEPSHILSE
jgi:hypothetical protein